MAGDDVAQRGTMIVIVDLLLRGILLPRTLTGREPPGLGASEGIPDLDLRLHS